MTRAPLAAAALLLVLTFTAASAAPLARAAEAVDPKTDQPVATAGVVEKTSELGPVKAVVRLQPDKPVIGDAVNVTVEVTAEDGIDLLMPEFGQSLDRFTIREFVPKETVDDKGRTISTQRYVLEPPLSGPQSIPPLMIEFVDRRPGQRPAPEGEDAYEIVTERIPFEVTSVVPDGASDELKPARGKLEPLREPGAAWPWVIALLVLTAVAAPLLYRYMVAARQRERRRTAYEIARARLDALLARGTPDQAEAIDAFFVELTAIIRRYLEDHFELRAPELTTEEFLNVASASPDLSEDHQQFLRDFLRRADMVKFARFIPTADDIRSAASAASRFLDQTRGNAHAAPDARSGDGPLAHGAARA